MKSQIALAALTALVSLNAVAAEKISCTEKGKKKEVATLEAKGQSHGDRAYSITMDEAITCGFFTVEDRIISQDKSENADKLSDWDGNSGVNISFRKGFLLEKAGATSRAYVKSYYDDGVTDSKSVVLECTVLR